MKLLKKSQPQKEAAPAVSLADRIRETCAAAEQYIEAEAQRIKATEGQPLPISWIRLNVYAMNGRCPCRAVLNLLSQKDNQS
jgi:hypothetical protein